ncbi:MAG TPA: hypothetical protein VIM53_04410 [Candidatus Saccharimonadales bacterium]
MKRFAACLVAVAVALCFVLVPASPVFAQSAESDICGGIDGATANGSCTSNTSGQGVDSLLATVINVFSAIIAAIAVIMMIYGGFQLVIGGNDPAKVKTGRSTLMYALIGLVVVGMAQFFVKFVLAKFAS